MARLQTLREPLFDLGDDRGMHLMDRGKLRIEKDGGNGAHAILRDQVGVVAAAVADVQAPHLAFGDAAVHVDVARVPGDRRFSSRCRARLGRSRGT